MAQLFQINPNQIRVTQPCLFTLGCLIQFNIFKMFWEMFGLNVITWPKEPREELIKVPPRKKVYRSGEVLHKVEECGVLTQRQEMMAAGDCLWGLQLVNRYYWDACGEMCSPGSQRVCVSLAPQKNKRHTVVFVRECVCDRKGALWALKSSGRCAPCCSVRELEVRGTQESAGLVSGPTLQKNFHISPSSSGWTLRSRTRRWSEGREATGCRTHWHRLLLEKL